MSNQAPNFDRVSKIYRWAEYFALGTLLEKTREHFIPHLSNRRRALVLGDGDGRFLAKLLAQNAALQAVAVDTSQQMLKLLTNRCAASAADVPARLTTLCASALTVQPPADTDLIITHFFLDCLTQSEVDTLTRQLGEHVPAGTLWVVSEFAVPDRPLLHTFARLYIRCLYLAFRVLTGLQVRTLPDPQSALSAAGFERLNRYESAAGLLYSELWRRR